MTLREKLEAWALQLRERSALRMSTATGIEMLDLLWPVIEAAQPFAKPWDLDENTKVIDVLKKCAERENDMKLVLKELEARLD